VGHGRRGGRPRHRLDPVDAGAGESRQIDPASTVAICKVGAGVVVPAGNPKPAIASAEDLKRALLAAKFIVFADPVRGGAAGIHIAGVIEKLGITEQTRPKTRLGAGGDITEVTLALGTGRSA